MGDFRKEQDDTLAADSPAKNATRVMQRVTCMGAAEMRGSPDYTRGLASGCIRNEDFSQT